MRVISGSAKGAKLSAPEGLNTRPTTDRIKETLFNIIAFRLNGTNVLDLFCGSGAMGIETLSRGSAQCVFVDNDKNAIRILETNLVHTKLAEKARSIFAPCNETIINFGKKDEKFDIIFLDPPYYKDYTKQTINDIMKYEILNIGGMIISEQGKQEEITQFPLLNIYKMKKFNTTNLVFYEYGCDNL